MSRFWPGVARVFELSFGELLWSRRTLFVVMMVGAPVLLAVAARLSAVNASVSINGASLDGRDMFEAIAWVLVLRFAVPILGVWYGTSLIADEVDDKTITYLFVRPVRRSAILTGKYLAYLACTGLVVLPSVAVVYFALVPMQPLSGVAGLLNNTAVLALGLAAYGALFALMGAALRKPLVFGLVFAFGWEPLALLVPGYLRRFTLAYHLEAAFRDLPAAGGSLACLLAITAICLVLAGRVVERREYLLEQ